MMWIFYFTNFFTGYRNYVKLFVFQVSLIRQNSVDAFGASSDDLDGVMFKVISHPEAETTSKPEMTVMKE